MGTFKHGYSKEYGPLYRCWIGMKRRCYNSRDASYMNYGGRGIVVCDEWKNDFVSFNNWAINNGWAIGLTIERMDVNLGYSPLNCTWIPKAMQVRNTRISKLIEYNGEKLTTKEWAIKTGISSETIRRRIFLRNWDVGKALTTPPESAIQTNKINEHDAITIFNSTDSADNLSNKYGVCKGVIWSIWRGSTWCHVTGYKRSSPKRKYKLTNENS
jgi:hypothetical protein